MKEIVKVSLENEMDLILAHKKAMKLCELTGFSLMAQTSIATAISEISRCAIEFGKNAVLILGIDSAGTRKFLNAVIVDGIDFSHKCAEALNYARRLVGDIEVIKSEKEARIVLKQQLNFGGTFSPTKIDSFVDYFEKEPPMSAYDEIRKKNLLLQEFADKIRESENEYRTLTDSLPLMIFIVNTRGMITYTNKWLEQFLGTIPKDITSQGWQNFIHPDDYSSFAKTTNGALQKSIPINGQYRIQEKDSNNFVWHMLTVIPLKNENETVHKWIGFMVDIHAHKLAEQALKDNMELKMIQNKLFENQEELQEKIVALNRSNYELEQFAHLATHDLQEPLRKLFFYADSLSTKFSDTLGSSGTSMLKNMTSAAGRMKELITDLLNYSQLQQQQPVFERVDLNITLREIFKDFEILIQEKKATFTIDPMPVINGNPVRLRQLFGNLISNALKYSRSNVPPHVQIRHVKENDQNVFHVKDNGIGFDDKYKERIFGLFERLHTKDRFPGTGIGLAICKRIAELHNGFISASSNVNEFAVFEVRLPCDEKSVSEQ